MIKTLKLGKQKRKKMDSYRKSFQSNWADLDPNGHMRHTAYNDYAAQLRLLFFEEHGFSFLKLSEMGIGPILFREETRFFREVRMGEKISVDVQLLKARKDASKWSFRQNIYKDKNEISASIEVDGAGWICKNEKLLYHQKLYQKWLWKFPEQRISNGYLIRSNNIRARTI